MKKSEQLRVLKLLQHRIETNTTYDAGGIVRSPVSDFTCPDLLRQEQQTFFHDTPLLMGLSADLPKNNTYWADSQTGTPILMTRNDRGEFHAFANVCRHRGAQVVPDGRGEKERFACPFHAWTYSGNGELIAVNKPSSFGHIDRSTHGLVELPSAERYGMLWVRPSPGAAIDVDECLGGLEEDMEHWGLGSHHFSTSQVMKADINWKLAIDTFGENYHFDVLHRDTLAPEFHGNLQTHDIYGMNYRMVFAYKRFLEVAQQIPDPNNWPVRYMSLAVYFIYPNTIVLVDQFAVDVLRMFPDEGSPGKSRTAHSWYLHESAVDHFDEHPEHIEERFEGFNGVIEREDYVMARSTQMTAERGILPHVIFGRNEPALHHYHNAHRKGLGRPLLKLEPAEA